MSHAPSPHRPLLDGVAFFGGSDPPTDDVGIEPASSTSFARTPSPTRAVRSSCPVPSPFAADEDAAADEESAEAAEQRAVGLVDVDLVDAQQQQQVQRAAAAVEVRQLV